MIEDLYEASDDFTKPDHGVFLVSTLFWMVQDAENLALATAQQVQS